MTIVVDFDGTCVAHAFPDIGADIGAARVLRQLTIEGHNLVLFTMRSDRSSTNETQTPGIDNVQGQFLQEAIKWFKENDIPLYGIQANPSQKHWTTSPKAYGELIIDDAALGCPLVFNKHISHRPFVDWVIVEQWLKSNRILQ